MVLVLYKDREPPGHMIPANEKALILMSTFQDEIDYQMLLPDKLPYLDVIPGGESILTCL